MQNTHIPQSASTRATLAFFPATRETYGAVVAKPYLVNDLTPGVNGSDASYLTNVNGTLYFFTSSFLADNPDNVSLRLWKSDGTKPGTVALQDISPLFVNAAKPEGLTNIDGIFYFLANTYGYKLWKSDGTPEGTVDVVNFGGNNYYPSSLLQNINGSLYFAVGNEDYYNNYNSHYDLWKSDGTEAGTFLLKELYPGESFVGIRSSINLNGTLYFTVGKSSYDEQGNYVTQTSLWKSDGTTVGTIPFKEFSNVEIGSLTQVKNNFYFTTGYYGELWTSDGTQDGTVKVSDLASPDLRNINDTLYFLADSNPEDFSPNYELWKSDGTPGGTVLIKDIKPGPSGSFVDSSNILNITTINDVLYFYADDGTHGYELWKSDGTEAGTALVKDIRPGSGSSTINNEYGSLIYPTFTDVNGILYFYADDGIHGGELWKSDGTQAGTVLVKDIKSGSASSNISSLINVDRTLYLIADDGIHGGELWQTDGTEAGTVLVADIKPGSASSNISNLTNIDRTLYFNADDGIHGSELWALNTNPAVASPIVSISAIAPNAAEAGKNSARFRISRTGDTSTALTVIYDLSGTALNGKDYNKLDGTIAIAPGQSFVDLTVTPVSDTYPEGNETVILSLFDRYYQYYAVDPEQNAATAIIADDPSAVVLTQPYPVKDIYPGIASSLISNLTTVNGILYFTANDGTHGRELWKSNGTAAGTVIVKDIVPGFGSSDPDIQNNIDGNLYFNASDRTDTFSKDLWQSDGTQDGTVLFQDLPGSENSYTYKFANVNGSFYFLAYESNIDSSYGYSLWKSDGTTAGTVKLKTSNYTLWDLINVNDTVYFTSYDETYGNELWKSDGTIAGTVLVKDIQSGFGSSNISNLTKLNNSLYFLADDGNYGLEVWKTDGSSAGTFRITDINPSSNDYFISNLTNANDILYFVVNDQYGYPQQLWTSNGTSAGTVLLKDISSTPDSFTIDLLTNFNGSFYFSINNPTSQSRELWKTDGTSTGTVLVKDINSANSAYYYATNFSNLTEVNGTLYFTYGDRLWKTDGTENGTVQVKDIFAGDLSYSQNIFNQLINANGTLYFSADDGTHGYELWKSDGTEAGTVLVQDLNLGSASSNPNNLTYLNETLYFTADDGIQGNELWAVKTNNIINIINGNNGRDPLIGTDGSDRIIGGTGKKTITGGAGNDEFVYTSIREVGQRITDFTVGEDKIVLTQLLDSLVPGGYNNSNAINDGYVRLVQGSTANSTILQIDRDGVVGNGVFRPFIELDKVTPQELNNVQNFAF